MLNLNSTKRKSIKKNQSDYRHKPGFLALSLAATLLIGTSNAFAQDNSTTNTTTTTINNTEKPEPSAAGLFVEPMLIGSNEDLSMKSARLPFVTSDTTGITAGYGFGLRLGIHLSEFFLGVDSRYNREQMSDSFYQTANADVFNYGPTVGVQMPYAGLRLLATYVTGGEFNASPGVNGLQLDFRSPTGWRGGLGFHVSSVSINLEYQDLTYGNTRVASLGSLAVNSIVNMQTETNGYLLSLSFPTEF